MPGVNAGTFNAQMLSAADGTVRFVAVGTVSFTEFLQSHHRIIIPVGIQVQKFCIAVVMIVCSRPVKILRRVIVTAGPVHTDFIIRRIPCSGIGSENSVRISGFHGSPGFFEKCIDDRSAPLYPFLEMDALFHPVIPCLRVLHPFVNVLRESFHLHPGIFLEFLTGEIGKVRLDVVIPSPVQNHAVYVIS